jgi:hypothetical protein
VKLGLGVDLALGETGTKHPHSMQLRIGNGYDIHSKSLALQRFIG